VIALLEQIGRSRLAETSVPDQEVLPLVGWYKAKFQELLPNCLLTQHSGRIPYEEDYSEDGLLHHFELTKEFSPVEPWKQ
jgi:hypothetical protein